MSKVTLQIVGVESNVLAHQMAARCAVTDIASHAISGGDGWHDITPPFDPDAALDLAQSVQYLDGLGLLQKRRNGDVKIRFGRQYPGGKL